MSILVDPLAGWVGGLLGNGWLGLLRGSPDERLVRASMGEAVEAVLARIENPDDRERVRLGLRDCFTRPPVLEPRAGAAAGLQAAVAAQVDQLGQMGNGGRGFYESVAVDPGWLSTAVAEAFVAAVEDAVAASSLAEAIGQRRHDLVAGSLIEIRDLLAPLADQAQPARPPRPDGLAPFTVRSRSRIEALELAEREGNARRRNRLVAVPLARRDAVLQWMDEHPPAAVVVPEGHLRVLVAPMGSGKSERAARWWQEGLQIAAEDERFEVPVWLQARAVGPAGLAAAVTQALGGDPKRPVRIVIDDVTWLPIADANRLLEDARQLVAVWEQVRILGTCRPGPLLAEEEQFDVDPWPAARGAELVELIAGNDALYGLDGQEVDDLLTSPLLALALAAHLSIGGTVRMAPAQLLADLATTILERERHQDLERSWQSLTRLAARTLSMGAPVPAHTLGLAPPQVWPLTDSGLVVADHAGLQFALPVFEQHLGAEALRTGIVDLHEIAKADTFPLWRYPLAHTVAISDPQTADSLLMRLARLNPGAASWVLEEVGPTLPTPVDRRPWQDAPGRSNEADPALRVGRWLREATEAFLAGFADFGTDLALHHRGHLAQWGVRLGEDPVHGTFMVLSEARDQVTPDLVTDTTDFTEPRRRDKWSRRTRFPMPDRALGRWQWARDRLRGQLVVLMRQRRLPVPEDCPLATEREWLLAQHIMRIHRRHEPRHVIELDDLSEAVEEMMMTVDRSVLSIWTSGTAQLDSHDIRWIQARLTRRTNGPLRAPRPGPDRMPDTRTRWRWRFYSPELTRTIVTAIIEDALVGYRNLVTTNFPQFGAGLGHYSGLPLHAEGQVIMSHTDPGDNDSFWYSLRPDPTAAADTPPRVDITVATAPQSLHDEASTTALQHRRLVFYRQTGTLATLPTGADMAATTLAYQWLIADLQALGWWSGPRPGWS